jgi:hypothetical protein
MSPCQGTDGYGEPCRGSARDSSGLCETCRWAGHRLDAVRCVAITAEHRRCRQRVVSGASRCWQHGRGLRIVA